MNKNKETKKAIDFQEWLNQELKNPKFKRYYEQYSKQLEIGYMIFQLRKQKKMSQAKLAKKIGVKQNSIAKMEMGDQNLTINILQRIASAFNCDLKIEFVK